MSKPSKLIGRKITGMRITGDNLVFDTNAGEVRWEALGDCCSYSAFTDIPKKPLRSVVLAVEPIEAMTDSRLDPAKLSKQEMHQEEEQIYGWVIRTARGEMVVIMRNWSNGYYGGWYTEV